MTSKKHENLVLSLFKTNLFARITLHSLLFFMLYNFQD